MAWVHIGPHKINTALVCYVEQEGETVRIYFNGEWEGNPLDLHFDEAKMFWRHLKAEDVMMAARDKGSATVLPKAGSLSSSKSTSSSMYDVDLGDEKPKPAASSSSSASSSRPPQTPPQKHGDTPKHSDHRKH